MYIFILEGGDVYQRKTVTEEEKMTADDGILGIIDCELMCQYDEGEWHDIQTWDA